MLEMMKKGLCVRLSECNILASGTILDLKSGKDPCDVCLPSYGVTMTLN